MGGKQNGAEETAWFADGV